MNISKFDCLPGGRLRQSSIRISPREQQVYNLAEWTVDDIAERLAISRNTVRAHLRSLFLKTGAETRAQLVAIRDRQAALLWQRTEAA